MRFLKLYLLEKGMKCNFKFINKRYRDKCTSASDKILLGDIPMGSVLTEGKQPTPASRWQKSKTWRSPFSPQIHQKYIYMWNNSCRTPTEHWQKTSDFLRGKKLPHVPG